MRAVFLCKLALAYQRALSQDLPAHWVDVAMRRRAWGWWSEAISEGIVVG